MYPAFVFCKKGGAGLWELNQLRVTTFVENGASRASESGNRKLFVRQIECRGRREGSVCDLATLD